MTHQNSINAPNLDRKLIWITMMYLDATENSKGDPMHIQICIRVLVGIDWRISKCDDEEERDQLLWTFKCTVL